MINYDSKEKFKVFNKPSFYQRVDEKHPLDLFLGLNDNGQKTIRFIGYFDHKKIKSSRIIEVKHLQYNDKTILNFSLLDIQYSDLFYLFCNDLIESSSNISVDQGYIFLVNRYEKWRTFGSNSRTFLSEHEIKGLIGELMFLNDFLISKYGSQDAILGWTGCEPTKKDFYYDDYWYEIKTSTKSTVTISSLEQLDGNSLGFLVVYNLEKMSPKALGITIKTLIESIKSKIEFEHSKNDFLLKLVDAGYYFDDEYDNYLYDLVDMRTFIVTKEFPKLTKVDIAPAITGVKYEILLNMIEDFREDVR